MNKAISEIIIAVFIVFIAISLTSVIYLFITGFSSDTTAEISKEGSSTFKKIGSCIEVVSFDDKTNNLWLKNCGRHDLKDISLIVDNIPQSGLNEIKQGEIKGVAVSASIGEHEVSVVGDYASMTTNIEVTTWFDLKFSDVKVAIVYERLSDARPKRTINEQINILKETNTDMIFRATWRWNPMPNSCLDVPAHQRQLCEDSGYSFEQFENIIQEIKFENPEIIIVGAVPAQRIVKTEEVNEITGETFNEEQVWDMALDPSKWGITSPTKEEFQNYASSYSMAGPDGYFPDITNIDFQKLFLSWVENQIDMGFNAIWIDLLYTQAGNMYLMTDDFNHIAVQDSYYNSSKIVDDIHALAESKGKQIYVGSWTSTMEYPEPYTPPKLDFVTVAPSVDELFNGTFNETEWIAKRDKIKIAFGDIPIFAFIDWAGDSGQIARFSQELNSEKQCNAIIAADEFFESIDIKFVYPVHGGSMGESATILAWYGQYGWYDSLAPEFQTYETIKELAQNKK